QAARLLVGLSWGFPAKSEKTSMKSMMRCGGGSGIRTHDTVSRIHAFQACALSHSAIPPERCDAGNITLHARVTNPLGARGSLRIGAKETFQLTQRTLPASLTS